GTTPVFLNRSSQNTSRSSSLLDFQGRYSFTAWPSVVLYTMEVKPVSMTCKTLNSVPLKRISDGSISLPFRGTSPAFLRRRPPSPTADDTPGLIARACAGAAENVQEG